MTWVDPELLHSGANITHAAGEGIRTGSNELAGADMARGMFGDFAAAHTFGGQLEDQHTRHVARMRQHHRALTDIGDKAHTAALGFIRTDQTNAASIRAVAPDEF